MYGAENETRTRDPNLGKVVLYQLSYFRVVAFSLKRGAKIRLFRETPNLFGKKMRFMRFFLEVRQILRWFIGSAKAEACIS